MIDAYMIVIKDNESSEYYAKYCLPKWKTYFDVRIFDAITPATLHKHRDLKFDKYSSNFKYTHKNLKADITDTEKACFNSHYNLWLESCYSKLPTLILEHDCYLLDPDKLWFDDKYGIIFYDNAAMGAYVIYPWFAEKLCKYAMDTIISCGPYSLISYFAKTNSLIDQVVNKQHKKFVAASDQVMSKKYGNCIEHYCNLHPEHWPQSNFHKFIEID